MWTTPPPLDQLPADAQLDPSLRSLPDRLASREQPPEQAVSGLGETLAALPEDQRGVQKALLFRETLDRINAERSQLIAGIKRYAKRQRELADRITSEGRELAELRREGGQAERMADVTEARNWDMRVFDDRQRSLTVLCDQPVRLEQRAFALARLIQGLAP